MPAKPATTATAHGATAAIAIAASRSGSAAATASRFRAAASSATTPTLHRRRRVLRRACRTRPRRRCGEERLLRGVVGRQYGEPATLRQAWGDQRRRPASTTTRAATSTAASRAAALRGRRVRQQHQLACLRPGVPCPAVGAPEAVRVEGAERSLAAAVRNAFAAVVPGAVVGPDARDLCSPHVMVTLPLKGTVARPKPRKLTLVTRTSLYSGATDADKLRLVCLPAAP